MHLVNVLCKCPIELTRQFQSLSRNVVISGPDFAQNSILNAQIHHRRCSYRTSIFSPKKNFRRPTAQPISAFLEEMKEFLRRTKITTGKKFCSDPSESHFRRRKCPKKRKITFLRWKCRNGPSGPPRRKIFEESVFAPHSNSMLVIWNCV